MHFGMATKMIATSIVTVLNFRQIYVLLDEETQQCAPGPCHNIKTVFSRYRDNHVKDIGLGNGLVLSGKK